MSDRQENDMFNKDTGDQEITDGSSDNNLLTNEHKMNVKTLERCFIERINILDTVGDRIQNAILTAIDSIVPPKIE